MSVGSKCPPARQPTVECGKVDEQSARRFDVAARRPAE
jgi:hypothetical protein